MKFGDLKMGDVVYVLHSNNDVEIEKVKQLSSHGGYIQIMFETTNIMAKVLANKSIYFDEEADVVLFMEKHRLKE
jgi:hypothetical protein